LRDDLLAGTEGEGSVTSAEVLEARGLDPNTVVKDASAVAADLYPSLETETIPETYDTMMKEENAPLLYYPATQPTSDNLYDALLRSNSQNIVVTINWLDAPSGEAEKIWAIWYAIDQPANRGQIIPYKAKCQTSIWSSICAWDGSLTLYFWRQSPRVQLSRGANSRGVACPTSMYLSSYSNNATYDIEVKWMGEQQQLFRLWRLLLGIRRRLSERRLYHSDELVTGA
jgi:hypothetical protein